MVDSRTDHEPVSMENDGGSRRVNDVAPSEASRSVGDGLLVVQTPSGTIHDQSPGNRRSDRPGSSVISFLSRRNRQQTVLEEVPLGERQFVHKYWLRRPRPLQYRYQGKYYESGDTGRLDLHEQGPQMPSDGERDLSRESSTSNAQSGNGETTKRSTDDAEVQRERLELFIDLLFVGIISNISEHFYEQTFRPDASTGLAVLEFILLFMPIWTVWSRLQIFLNAWFMDDMIQRVIVLWILVLSLVYGNNVPYFLLNDNNRTNNLIVSYLIAKISLVSLESVYSIFIPWLRRFCLVSFLLSLPSTVIWIMATITSGWVQVGLVIAGIMTDYVAFFFFLSPLGERVLSNKIQKARDEKHTMKRYENFFIIALGEGVILLIRGSPAEEGLNVHLANAVLVLLILYFLNFLYFNSDGARHYCHALYRRWYIKAIWGYMHIPLFMNLVLLSSGVLYLVKYKPESGSSETAMEAAPSRRAEASASESGCAGAEVSMSHETFRVATTAVCINTAIILFTELVIALLNRPLDPPKTLIINNRYLRLMPRMAAVLVLLTLWLHDFPDASSILGTISLILWIVLQFEWYTSMERGGGIIEPKEAWQQMEESKS